MSTSGFADIKGARLYYEVAGEGHPLVLTHAGIADLRMWDDQFDVFSRRFRTIRWDLRSYGRTAMPPGPYSGRSDLHGLLRVLDVERAHLVGLSMGGRISIDFALEHPRLVSALIPVASGLGGYQSPPNPIRDEIEAAIKLGDVARAVELELRRWVDGPNRTPEQVDPRVREKVRQMDTDAFAHPAEAGQYQPLDPPAIGRLEEIRVPTLIIVGDQDVPYILDIAQRLEAGISGAKRVVISGAAHMVNMERPMEFNRIVLEFLAGMHGR